MPSEKLQAVEVINESGKAPLVLVCEHACNFVPAHFHNLGLDADVLDYHIAWDPGALAVAKEMSRLLDAPLVAAKVSRLVYDCNRPPEAADAMPTRSEVHDIPGNMEMSDEDRAWRVEHVYNSFHQVLGETIKARMSEDVQPVVVTVHSYVPVYQGVKRDVEMGILHDADSRLADHILKESADLDYDIRRNEPYSPSDGVTHTLRRHAIENNLANVMIEIRNDLISDPEGVSKAAKCLSTIIEPKLADLSLTDKVRRER
ncbi:N-formylglutamate amidohydrolase [Terasakiella pusilla]|uniref:N-formylglutamate amidohydrolase n=1 Tax=Terasakiella pusilla TaxID=64973 RepID=UPI00048F2613|nr:N-formylglutamate amidohydrolase [Terasakiella pusilla]